MRALSFRSVALAVALDITLVSCGSDTATGPTAVPGQLTVTLTGPNADDRALLLDITGPGAVTNVSGVGDYLVFSKPGAAKASVAVFGTITNGAILRISVPDVAAVSSYTATITEAAGEDNMPRSSLAGYSAAVTK